MSTHKHPAEEIIYFFRALTKERLKKESGANVPDNLRKTTPKKKKIRTLVHKRKDSFKGKGNLEKSIVGTQLCRAIISHAFGQIKYCILATLHYENENIKLNVKD